MILQVERSWGMAPGDFYDLDADTRTALLADWRLSHETADEAKAADRDSKRRRLDRLQTRRAS